LGSKKTLVGALQHKKLDWRKVCTWRRELFGRRSAQDDNWR